MIDDIKQRLASLTYTVVPEDEYNLMFVAEKVENRIKNLCNISEIPDGLKNAYIDMVCAEFLKFKYNTNQLNDDNFSIDDAVSSVSLGDANVSFGAVENKFDTLLQHLNRGESELVCYRKIRW